MNERTNALRAAHARSRKAAHTVLAATVVLAAACGGGSGSTTGPQDPSKPGPAPTSTAPQGTAGTGSARGTSTAPPSGSGTRAIAASTMAGDLKEIGLDPKGLPPLNKMDPEKLRKVMKTFTKALGTQCNGCHDPNDFRAPTPKKKIAARMWNDFTRGLTMEDGTPVYCDACHGGKMQFLDRHDLKALGAWMDQNMVTKLKRTDGKDHGCETCHGDPFEPKILTKLWK
jgi:cytochrome c7-like protein